MRGAALRAWLSALPLHERDRAVDELLGLDGPPPPHTPPGEHLVGYHASGVDAIVEALRTAQVDSDDVVVDLGSGLGKVVLLAHLLTGARARGIEIQSALVERARVAAARLGADVRFTHADARVADIDDGTIFFLYAPFTGSALADVLERLRSVAWLHPIVVCALGLDLERAAPWLARRPVDSFWLAVYDGRAPCTA